MTGWDEVADGVLVRRCAELDLTVGLVLGSEQALVIDTGGDHRQGAELAESVRAVTALPWQVVLTHGHFDHCFGTSAFRPAPVWAHAGCARYLHAHAERQRAEWVEHYQQSGRADIAEALAETAVIPPDRAVRELAEMRLGGRDVELRHLGAGHTDHDLVVSVPDAGVVFAGDLVEQGAAPDFEDAVPADWPAAVGALLALRPSIVVPGHGDPVGPGFVAAQHAELAHLAALCRSVRRGDITEERALHDSPYPAATTARALHRTPA